MSNPKDLQPDQIFTYGIQEVIDSDSLQHRLSADQPLVIKLGVDPTSADLHLGHAVVLRKLRQFQDLGHQAVLVIGDFTAKIGDPSGKTVTRPVPSAAEIKTNMKSYTDQASIILDISKTKIVYNSTWHAHMNLDQFMTYAMQIGLTTLLDREDFSARLKNNQSIGLHELLYPLTQAIDSVELKAEVEIGGWDQRLNLLLGRELQKKLGQTPQEIVILKPLIGLDGKRKMSKSYDNFIGLAESPDQMFGKLMSIPDELIDQYAELAALLNDKQIEALPKHPRERKAAVATSVVTLYHGAEQAKNASERFTKVFSDKQDTQELTDEVQVPGSAITLLEAVKQATGVSSSEAQRLITQRGVKLNREVSDDPNRLIDVSQATYQLQVGKHRFYELIKED